jgi:hypothetical protein
MNMRSQLAASTSRFAHLLGLDRASAARAEDDDDKKEDAARADEGEGDEEERDEPKEGKKAKKAKSSEDDDDKEDAARADDGGEDEDEPKDTKKAKKAKGSEDDDETCDDEQDDYAKGQKAERSRWSKVLGSAAAGSGRTAAACEILASTSMSAKAVIATLGALPATAKLAGLGARMSGVRPVDVGGDGGGAGRPDPKSSAGLAEQIIEAGKIRRGEKI